MLAAGTTQADLIRPYAVTPSGQYNSTNYAAARVIDPAGAEPPGWPYQRLTSESTSALHPADPGTGSTFGEWVNATGLVGTNWLKFQLGPSLGGGTYAKYNLTKAYIWQGFQNNGTLTNRGIQNFGLWVSTDNGATYTQVGGKQTLVQCPREGVSSSGLNSIAQTFNLPANGVTHVWLTVSNNFGGDNYLTLSAVRFEGTGPSSTLTWSGNPANNAWDLATANWNNGAAVFSTGSAVTFDDTSANPNVTLTGLLQPWNVTVSAAQNYTFTGSGSFITIGGPNDNSLAINGPGQVIFNPTAAVTNASPLSGMGTLVKQGANSLTLAGDNSAFNGTVAIGGGTLKMGSATALGPLTGGTTVISNTATLDLAGFSGAMNNQVTVSGSGANGTNAITSSAAIATPFIGLRYVTLAGDTIFSTPTRWDIGNGTAGGSLVGGGYKLTLTGPASDMSLNYLGETDLGDVVVSNRTLYIQGSTTTLGRTGNSVFVNPGSTLSLFGAGVNLNKPLSLNGGTLADSSANVSYLGPITVTNTVFTNSYISAAAVFTISGVIAGAPTSTLTFSGAGTTVLTAPNTFPGSITNAGKLQLGDGVANNGSLATNIVNNATLIFANPNPQTYSGAISGSGSLTVNGPGTLTLGGANTYTNSTTVSAGILQLGAANALPAVPGGGNVTVTSTLDLNAFSPTINGLSGGGVVDNVSAGGNPMLTVGANNASSTFAGTLKNSSGSLGLTKIGLGTLTLSGANTLTGGVAINAGTLVATTPTALGPGAVSVAGSAGLALGPINVAGANTLTLASDLTLQAGATVRFRVSANNLSGNDQITGVANLNFNGTDTIMVDGVPTLGVPYTLITYTGALNGSAANLVAVMNAHGSLTATFDTTSTPGAVLVTFGGSGGAANLVWRGDATPTNSWQVGVVSNWFNGTGIDLFYGLDNVTFDDTISSTNRLTVNLATIGINAGNITVNTTNTYTFQGGLINAPLLLKTNTGGLTFLGPATINSLVVTQGVVYPKTASLTFTNVAVGPSGLVYDVTASPVNNPGGLMLGGTLRQGGSVAGTWNGPITLTGPASIISDSGSTLTLPGSISGANRVTFSGATAILTSSGNNWSGGGTIASGTLQIGSAAAGANVADGSLGSGILTNNGTLLFRSAGALPLGNVIYGTGALTENNGLIVITNANFYSGATTLGYAGKIQVAASGGLSTNTVTIGSSQTDTSGVQLSGGIRLSNSFVIGGAPRAFAAAPHIENLSETNTIVAPSPVLIGTGGNSWVMSTDSGKLIYVGNLMANGGGTRILALEGSAGYGEIQGVVGGTSGNQMQILVTGGTWQFDMTNGTCYALETYAGATSVVGPSGAFPVCPTIQVDGGGTLDVSQRAGGWSLASQQTLDGIGTVVGNVLLPAGGIIYPGVGTATVGTLTLANNLTVNGGLIKIGLNSSPAAANDLLLVQGNLNLSYGALQIGLLGGPLTSGTYPLIQFTGNLVGDVNNLTLQGVPGGSLVLNGKEIDLVFATPSYVTWTGDGAVNQWDVNASLAWVTNGGGSPIVFNNGEVVTFDDTGYTNPLVNLPGTVKPGGIVFNNTLTNYTVAGAGKITGGAYLVMNGTGALTLNTTNDFNGGITLNGGVVNVPWMANGGVPSPLGAASAAALNFLAGNTVIQYTGPSASSDRGLTFTAPVTIVVTNTNTTLTVAGPVSGNASAPGMPLTKDGPGTLVLAGAGNSYGYSAGTGTIVSRGTLQLGNGGTAGFLGGGTTTLGANTSLVFNRADEIALSLYNPVSGSGSLVQLGPGRLDIQMNMSYSGGTIISNGQFCIQGGSWTASGPIIVDGGALVFDTLNNTFGAATATIAIPFVVNAGGVISNFNRFTTFGPLTLNGGTIIANGGANAQSQAYCLNNSVSVGGSTVSSFTALTTNTNSGVLIGGGAVSNVVFTVAHNAADTDLLVSAPLIDGYNASSVTQPGSITKLGAGKMVLAATNTYSGGTTISNGTLLVNGSIASGVTVAGGALGGAGAISGSVDVLSGATLAPGPAFTALTIGGALTLETGSTCYVEIDGGTLASDKVTGPSTVTYGGTLVVTNLGGTTALTNGAAFKLFAASAYNASSFAGTNLPPLGPTLAWDTSFLAVDGTLRIKTAFVPQPVIVSFGRDGLGNLILQGTNGAAGSSYTVLSSTNVAAPLSTWTTNTTGAFSGSGAFSNAIPLNVTAPQHYYLLRVP